MKRPLFLLLLILLLNFQSRSQYYFPPVTGSQWDTISPQSLGWCTDRMDSLYQMLDQKNTKAFIILKDGKIAVEKYFDTFTKDSAWFWASAGKTITSFLIGKAQEEGMLSIHDSTSKFLGTGWTSCTPEQEGKITVRHQLTMTTGLNYQVPDLDCKTPACLTYKADAGTQWYYHNAPYLLLQDVIEHASGLSYQNYTATRLLTPTGMTGLWYNGVFYSKPRAMARFGSLILNKGKWNQTVLLNDTAYYNQMVNTSQNLNESYGYLFWLNGKSSFRLPGTTASFLGKIIPAGPDDLICGLGKYDQKLYVWPSQQMVIIRMGEASDSSEVPIIFDQLLWTELNKVFCNIHSALPEMNQEVFMNIYPNPANEQVELNISASGHYQVSVMNSLGQVVLTQKDYSVMTTSELANGIYLVSVTNESGFNAAQKLLVQH